MPHPLLASANEASKPIWLVTEQTWHEIAGSLPPMAQGFAKAQGFTGKAGSHCLLPDANGDLLGVAFGINGVDTKHSDPFLPGKLSTLLPEGVYRFETEAPNPTLRTMWRASRMRSYQAAIS
ncbi:MAG: leucyl aminopeptidase [Microvirga sp.]|nr:leucyl aminopeptidase [Microvirga sp.]